jgi:membrane-associated phospholipid phosphatase
MEKRIAKAISYLFHPLVMPFLGFLVISHSGTYAASIDKGLNNYLGFMIFGITLVLPVTFIPLYFYTRLIKSVGMENRNDRVIPFFITTVFYFIAFVMVHKTPVSRIYSNFMLAACLSVFLVFVISVFWKISIHLAGLGGIVGLIICLSMMLDADLILLLAVSVFLAGITAYARLRLNAHTPAQVYAGFMLGLITMLGVMMLHG